MLGFLPFLRSYKKKSSPTATTIQINRNIFLFLLLFFAGNLTKRVFRSKSNHHKLCASSQLLPDLFAFSARLFQAEEIQVCLSALKIVRAWWYTCVAVATCVIKTRGIYHELGWEHRVASCSENRESKNSQLSRGSASLTVVSSFGFGCGGVQSGTTSSAWKLIQTSVLSVIAE